MSINTKLYIEEYLKIKDKNARIIPFKLNTPQQKLYDKIKEIKKEHKPVRIIILKARQMGFSTLTEAILFKETVTHTNINAGIIAHEAKATNNLFNMSKLYYDNLPEGFRPQILNRNAQELIFNTKENTGLNSKLTCMTAGTGSGRSGTYNLLHLSELAFWEGDIKEALLSIMQTVPNNDKSMVIIESTANGYNYFKELWDKAVKNENDFIPFFVGWNELEEYQMPYTGFELTDYEKEIKENYNLTNDQLEWRRWCIRNNCSGDEDMFKQEYPICPEEAFLNSGSCVFDTRIIHNRLAKLKKPLKTGFFTYDYDDTLPRLGEINPYTGGGYAKYKISNIKWQNDPKGFIKIYELPNSPEVSKYAIGGDTAGNGIDYFTAHVINAKTMNQCAVLRHQMDADLYAKQMYCLGLYYKKALIGIESNFDSFPIKELERLGYKHQYMREQPDDIRGKVMKQYGFRTDSRTRPNIISNLQQFLRQYPELINDRDTLDEMLEFVYNDSGRPEAQEGSHDDLVMGLAIALEITTQVHYPRESIQAGIPYYDEHQYSEVGEIITPF